MKCSEVRNLALAYLDSELDARASREIDLHIGVCDGCRRIYETEDLFGTRLTAALNRMDASPELWKKIESDVMINGTVAVAPLPPADTPQSHPSWLMTQRGWAVAAVLVLLLGLGGGSAWLAKARQPLDLAMAVEHCHIAHASKLADPTFTGPPDAAALSDLHGRLGPAAFDVRPGDPSFLVSGSRLCEIENVPVAFVLGEQRSIPVSMIVMDEVELAAFPGVRKRLDAGHPAACSRIGAYEFAARRVGGLVVCLIADLPRSKLESLLASIPSR